MDVEKIVCTGIVVRLHDLNETLCESIASYLLLWAAGTRSDLSCCCDGVLLTMLRSMQVTLGIVQSTVFT